MSRWNSSPGASNVITMGPCDFWKIPTHLHIWVYEYLRYKYLSKSRDKVVMIGRSAPCCSLLQMYSYCPILLTDWNLSRMRIPSTLLIKLVFQSNTVLYLYLSKFRSICVMSICKQKVYIKWRGYKSRKKTIQHLCLFQIYTSLSLIPGRGELHE